MPLTQRGEIWWIDLRHDGRRIRVSTGTADRRAAQEYHDRYKAALWREAHLDEAPDRTWNDAVKRWLAEHQGKKSLETDRLRLKWISRHLAGVPLSAISADTVEGMIALKSAETWQGKPVTPATINRTMAALSAILNAAKRWGWLPIAPPIRHLAEPKKRVAYLTREQAVRLVAELPIHLGELFCFALATGLRENNVLGLEWSQVDMARCCAWVHADQAKAGQTIAIPLSAEAMAVLAMRQGIDARYVFTFGGRVLSRASNHAWYKATARAGIPGFRWHDIRHTWASWHTMAGTPKSVLQELGGWRDGRMVDRYAHLSPGYLAQWAGNAAPDGHVLDTTPLAKKKKSGPKAA